MTNNTTADTAANHPRVPEGTKLYTQVYVDTLRAQLEAAESDAARYRWLRDNCQNCADEYSTSGQLYFGTYAAGGLDAEIDSARTKAATP